MEIFLVCIIIDDALKVLRWDYIIDDTKWKFIKFEVIIRIRCQRYVWLESIVRCGVPSVEGEDICARRSRVSRLNERWIIPNRHFKTEMLLSRVVKCSPHTTLRSKSYNTCESWRIWVPSIRNHAFNWVHRVHILWTKTMNQIRRHYTNICIVDGSSSWVTSNN